MAAPSSARSTILRSLFHAVLFIAIYFVVAKLGLRYATIGPSISPVWPPTGLAIAGLVLLGLRYWPAVLVGAFLANATTGVPMLAAAGMASGNAVEALLGAYLLRRFSGRSVSFEELGSVRALVGVAAPVGALASATIAVTTLVVSQVIPAAGSL